jgi:two-component system, OmpR family, phosphate regulon sensor histidine kinase PhoR
MTVFPLQAALFVLLLVLIGVGITAVFLDRYQMRQKLLPPVGTDPNRLAELFDSAPLGLLLLDKQTDVLYANQLGQRLLPVLTETEDAGWREELMQDLALVAATSVSPKFDSRPRQRLLTLAPDRRLSWWLCPLPQMTLLLLFDLSQTYQMQRASQRFLGTLSHELRTPLTAVLAHLDIVNQPETDPATRQSSLAIAQQEMKRLARLVHDMLQLGRLEMSEGVEKRPLDLFLVAEAAVADIILTAEEKGIAISLEATPPLPLVHGDGDRLTQAMLNVLDNSVKYGRDGDTVQVMLTPEGDGVRCTIRDSGPGIPPTHLPHVSQRLYRARPDEPGSGLGLAITAEILRLHQTRLEIKSPPEGYESGVEVSFLLTTN